MRSFFLTLLIAGLLPPVAAGQDAAGRDSGGRFTVYAGGREAGYERFHVVREAGAVRLHSEAELTRDDRRQELSLDIGWEGGVSALRAVGRQGSRERIVTLAVSGGRLMGETREGEVSATIDLAREDGALVVAPPFAAPWAVAVARYDLDRGGRQTFPALFPMEGRTGSVTMLLREEEAITIDGRAVLCRRILARPDRGDAVNLWVDGDGRLAVLARSVAGISAVRGHAVVVGLKPGEDPPDPPYAHSVRIRFASEGGTLAGSLMRPREGDGPFPAVLLLSGSGPQDRNGNAPGAELQWNVLHSIAAALAERGIASLRYDERGVGGSTGTFYDAGFRDLLGDARSALEWLRTRGDVDPRRIALFGHSEGALLAATLSRRGVAAVVLAGAPAEPLDRILVSQVRRRLEERGATLREEQRTVGDLVAYFEHIRLSRSDVVEWHGRRREARWLREHMELDPLAIYRAVPCPALVVHGARDVQVDPSQAARVAAAVGTEPAVLTGLDHFLLPSRGGLADYGDARRTVAPEALRTIGEWLQTRLAMLRK